MFIQLCRGLQTARNLERSAIVVRLDRGVKFALAVFALCVAGRGLLAAEPEIIFEDDFSELESSFPPSDASVALSVENKTLLVSAQPNRSRENFYQSMLFQDIDLSVRMQLASPDARTGGWLGFAFWGLDSNHYHVVSISDSGHITVQQFSGNRVAAPLSWRDSNALKTGANDWNELRVLTVGNRATIYLNGQKLVTYRGQPPESGSLIGPVVAGADRPISGRFSNLRVVVPSGPDAKPSAAPSDPNLILADDFAQFDPGWGEESESMFAKNNVFLIKPALERVQKALYLAALVDDIDMTVTVAPHDEDPDYTCSAGIIFWANSWDDYYMFDVYEDGKVDIAHRLKERWLFPLSARAPAAPAQFKPDAPNELRLVTNGRKATAYLNGTPVGNVSSATPLPSGWQFGLAAESGKKQAAAEFRSLVVRKPRTSPK